MTVRMIHPDLPGQPILANEAAVVIHERAGWRVEDEKQRPAVPEMPAVVPAGHTQIVHPASGAYVNVPDESVSAYRPSGWLTRAEHEANQSEAAARAAAESKPKAARPAASSKEE
jgi:hypothetical protein